MIFSLKSCCSTLLILVFAGSSLAWKFSVPYKWKYVDYVWDSDEQKQEAIDSGRYDHTQIYIQDCQPLPDGRVLVTMPKRFADNHASIALVSDELGDGGPLLKPYPNWRHHKASDCSGITSINRVVLDDCNRLWGIDTGIIAGERVCKEKLYGFNAATDEIIEMIEIPDSVSLGSTIEVFAVETSESSPVSKDITIWIADITNNGLLIWDGKRFWRRSNDLFYGSANHTAIEAGGHQLDTNVYGRGISIALLPPEGVFNEELLFFKDLTTKKSYFADRNQLADPAQLCIDFYELDETFGDNEIVAGTSADGVKFFGLASSMTLGCWNMLNPAAQNYTHVWETDEENFQFASSIKFVDVNDTEIIWVTTNRLPRFLANEIDWNDYNFRINSGNVSDLIAGTVCDPEQAVRRRFELTSNGITDDAAHSGWRLLE